MSATTIYLDLKDVPPQLLSGYTGRKFKLEPCAAVALGSRYWGGGTRSTWRAVRLSDGAGIDIASIDQSFANPPQFGGIKSDPIVPIPQGIVFVEHSIFCGKDMGLTFYARQDDVAALLPAPNDTLNNAEQVVLYVTKALKGSYGGRNPRLDAATGSYAYERGGRPAITAAEYEAAKVALIASGHLNKAGAITTKGRNSIGA